MQPRMPQRQPWRNRELASCRPYPMDSVTTTLLPAAHPSSHSSIKSIKSIKSIRSTRASRKPSAKSSRRRWNGRPGVRTLRRPRSRFVSCNPSAQSLVPCPGRPSGQSPIASANYPNHSRKIRILRTYKHRIGRSSTMISHASEIAGGARDLHWPGIAGGYASDRVWVCALQLSLTKARTDGAKLPASHRCRAPIYRRSPHAQPL